MATAIRQHDTFLEQAIENLGDIPPDLMRYLSLIKALDSKCETLSDRIQESVDALLAMPPVQSNPSAAFQRLQAKIEEDRKMLMQFSSEKVHVSSRARKSPSWHAWTPLISPFLLPDRTTSI